MMEFPICLMCEHFEGGLNESGVARCAAFPTGIPDEILKGMADHREPFGTETILFSPKKGVTPEKVEEWAEMAEQARPFLKGMPPDPEDDEVLETPLG